jgi:hypothetical protein
LGVFIAPTTIPTVVVDGHTGHCIIHCPVRAMSTDRWGLERLTVEVLCPLAAPNSLVCSVFAVLTSDFGSMHCSLCQRGRSLVKLTVAPLAHLKVHSSLL